MSSDKCTTSSDCQGLSMCVFKDSEQDVSEKFCTQKRRFIGSNSSKCKKAMEEALAKVDTKKEMDIEDILKGKEIDEFKKPKDDEDGGYECYMYDEGDTKCGNCSVM